MQDVLPSPRVAVLIASVVAGKSADTFFPQAGFSDGALKVE